MPRSPEDYEELERLITYGHVIKNQTVTFVLKSKDDKYGLVKELDLYVEVYGREKIHFLQRHADNVLLRVTSEIYYICYSSTPALDDWAKISKTREWIESELGITLK